MTMGTGPQALTSHIATAWQATRTGRPDVPDVVRDGGGNALTDQDAVDGGYGVVVTRDRQIVGQNYAVHDYVHCYHPEAAGLSTEDKGFNEKGTVETVQIDVECKDRNDDQGNHLDADTRMVGDRSDPNFPSDETPPYPGLLGEVTYTLELAWLGLGEWDVTDYDEVSVYLDSSNASVSLSVELEHIATNTV